MSKIAKFLHAMNDKVKIDVRNLHKSFDGTQILKGVALEIRDGEAWVLLGSSGSGKSVLLKCILGLLDVDAGDVLVDGAVANSHETNKSSCFLMIQLRGWDTIRSSQCKINHVILSC